MTRILFLETFRNLRPYCAKYSTGYCHGTVHCTVQYIYTVQPKVTCMHFPDVLSTVHYVLIITFFTGKKVIFGSPCSSQG